ncbi:mechanosensitive ion channel family protein [Pseudomonas sp. HK3]
MPELLLGYFNQGKLIVESALFDQATYVQLVTLVSCYCVAYWIYVALIKKRVVKKLSSTLAKNTQINKGIRATSLLFPLIAIIFLRLASELFGKLDYAIWLIDLSMSIAILLLFYSIIKEFVASYVMSQLLLWFGLPVLLLHLQGVLPALITELEAISISAGNISVSLYGLLRMLFFGSLIFWLSHGSNNVGKNIIRNQQSLDASTREVFSKLFEVALFFVVALLLLNIMGINLTALAVFGGGLGVGLGLGLQSIASNFISGIIILLDKSLTIGDFVELDDGRKGFVREFKMRHAILETYDGKDILVPNETFISNSLINWTHKDPKQRYRVDFSVAYSTDIRTMVELIKEEVSKHPQVISGLDIPFEERPDCEIDSFGDNGVNMFVEFWMEGIDDGKNRVGGDLLLTIFETLKDHHISIPFPQREVKILNEQNIT